LGGGTTHASLIFLRVSILLQSYTVIHELRT